MSHIAKPIEINIYGSGTSSQMYLSHLLDIAFKASDIGYVIKHINDVNQFIAKNINTVPSIEIDGEVIFELKGAEDYHTHTRKFIQEFLKTHNFGNMKKILVPTDFSPCSTHAFGYAMQLAHYMNAYVSLLHVYYPAYEAFGVDSTFYDTELTKRKTTLEKLVSSNNKDFIGEVLNTPMVEGETSVGLPTDVIIEASKTSQLVVLGAQGYSALKNAILGSVSQLVAIHAKSNVMVIPANATFKPLNKIALFLSYGKLKEKTINQFSELANTFGADVDLVHFLEHGKSPKDDPNSLLFQKALKGKCEVKLLYGNDFKGTVNEFLALNEVDLISIVRKKKSYFVDLFIKSHTEEMLSVPKTPILVVHE
jgi:nucleotide-binding universal stress UspA family protein